MNDGMFCRWQPNYNNRVNDNEGSQSPKSKEKRIECVSETDDEQYKKKKRNLKRLTLQFS
jgi:hypothetical protein